MRFLRAFRTAFWAALHGETSRRHPHVITLDIDAEHAQAALATVERQLDVIAQKAEYAALLMGRIH